MNDYRSILESLAWRTLVAAPFFVVGVTGLLSYASPAFILAGAIIMASPLARLLAEPWGNLFYPTRHFDRPQPMYSIPQSKRAKGLYEEAIAGLERIAEEYPDEAKPYIEMIDIAIVHLNDPDRADAIYQRGISQLKKDEEKEVLARMYGAIRTRLNARPSN